jgi:hypothetical protein
MGKGLHSRFFVSQTLLTKSVIMHVNKDKINSNIGACCDKERGVTAVLGSIRKVDVKPDVEFGGDRHRVWCVNNTREDDRRVIIRKIDLL